MSFEGSAGLITNIQRFSVDDGPGIRTTVFFKGCNLACRWCHNPETISGRKQIQYQKQSCGNCGRCAAICDRGAQKMIDGRHVMDREACTQRLSCAGVCPYGALSVLGREIGLRELGEQLLRDNAFYDRSGGGVTLSGGEPLLQAEFCAGIFRYLKERHVHTALDTAGNVAWSNFEAVLPWVDLVLFDIKIVDENRHREMTGGHNRLILENFERLCREKADIWIRTPLMAGVNDGDDETDGRIRLLREAKNVRQVELLPYHSYGTGKYAALGAAEALFQFQPPSPEKISAIVSRMAAGGVRACCNS
jgi:pyruvate formate lyase activating enzyme